jgi:hypothetical protein
LSLKPISALERLAQALREVVVAGQRALEGATHHLSAALCEKGLGRGVGVGHVEVLVEHQHGCG